MKIHNQIQTFEEWQAEREAAERRQRLAEGIRDALQTVRSGQKGIGVSVRKGDR